MKYYTLQISRARNYDPALGRWMNLDPLAEKELKPNESTMESKQKDDKKNVPKKVKITITKIYLTQDMDGKLLNYSRRQKDTMVDTEDRTSVKEKSRQKMDSLLNIINN